MGRLSAFLGTLLFLCVTACAQYPGAQPVPQSLKADFDAVKIDDAKRILTFLATKCEGRGTGQRGFRKAAGYVANEFKMIGLKPLGDRGTYFQRAQIGADPENSNLTVKGPGGAFLLKSGDYFYVGPIGSSKQKASLTGLPVFVNYSRTKPQPEDAAKLKDHIVFLTGWSQTLNSVAAAKPIGIFQADDQPVRNISARLLARHLK